MTTSDKWLVFDFDGTLANSFKMAHEIFNSLSGKYHYRPVSDHEVEAMRRMTAMEFFSALGVSLLKLPFVAIQARHELRQHIAEVPLIPGISEVLPVLRQQGYRMGVLSSNSTENVSAFLQSHGLNSYFDFTYCSRDVFGKARRIKALIRKYKLDPASLVYVGDMNVDVEAAHHAGVKVAAVSWGYQAREVLEEHNPTWLLDTPDQLAGL